MKKASKPRERDRSGALYAVVGNERLDRLDAWVTRINEGRAGPLWTRNDLVKAILDRAISERGESREP